MKKKLAILTVVAVIAALISFNAIPAWAQTTWNVPGDTSGTCTTGNPSCDTIQEAIDAATSGDTVNVATGTYNEDLTIAKGLTLTTSTSSGATIDGGIWIKDLDTFTNPITVEYFTIENGTTISGIKDFGIKITGDPGLADKNIVDMHIVNNTFINCGKTDNVEDETWFNAAIFYDANHFGALGSRYDTVFTGIGEISHNTIINNLADNTKRTQLGIGVRSGRNMEINYNNISGNVAEGIHHWGPVNTTSIGGYQMDHNTIDLSGWMGSPIGNNPRGIWSYARHSTYSYNTIISIWYGMVLSYWDDTNWGGGTAADHPVTVSHNLIHPPASQSMSVGLRIGGNNSQITNNEIYGATNNVTGRGIGLIFEGWDVPAWGERTECKNNTFTANYIHDNYDGIFTWDPPYANTQNNVFHCNKIVNNSNYGFYNGNTSETVNAKNNWWGSATGPTHSGNPGGTGDAVSDYVDYDPWTPGYYYSSFDPPVHGGAVKVKKNRVIPFKAALLDVDGNPVTDADITTPPVIQVIFQPTVGDADDVTDDALSAGQGTDGNQFVFDFAASKWRYNLKTRNYTGQGTYTVTMVSGDECEYIIYSAPEAQFVIE